MLSNKIIGNVVINGKIVRITKGVPVRSRFNLYLTNGGMSIEIIGNIKNGEKYKKIVNTPELLLYKLSNIGSSKNISG